jgi:hypothetical protein
MLGLERMVDWKPESIGPMVLDATVELSSQILMEQEEMLA